jgi:queuine tRNA-ribosyltransferase
VCISGFFRENAIDPTRGPRREAASGVLAYRCDLRMSGPIQFTISKRCRETRARLGRVETAHGGFETPAFMPVGTKASIKGLTPDHIRATGSQIILNNAYHLMLRPGDALIAQLGGVHEFMRWGGPILTDSGGYQAFSLSDINLIDDDGVTFRSIVDGSTLHLSPERSIEVQNNLGADIIMAFDDCPPCAEGIQGSRHQGIKGRNAANAPSMSRPRGCPDPLMPLGDRLIEANDRTIRWLHRCVKAHRRPSEQALFGIIQGGTDCDLRRHSVEAVCNVELPGYAIGGVAVGESPDLIHEVVQFTAPMLPDEKPRYLMGVGYERDIVTAVQAGVDMFDCVLPTRNGRNGNIFTRNGRLHLRNAIHREDSAIIEPGCDCLTCKSGFSRAYLRHLFLADEMLGPILASIHNIWHFQRLMLDIRQAIREDDWSSFTQAWPVAFADQPDPAEAAPGV